MTRLKPAMLEPGSAITVGSAVGSVVVTVDLKGDLRLAVVPFAGVAVAMGPSPEGGLQVDLFKPGPVAPGIERRIQ